MSTPDLTIEALRGMIEGLMNDTLRFSDPKLFYGTDSVWVPTLWHEGQTTTPSRYCVCGGEWSGGGQCRQCGARR